MKQYQDLLRHIMIHGKGKDDRTGTGTISIFGYQTRYDLREGFPLVTTKKVHFKSIVHELLWFLSGNTNTKYLEDNGVTIWREWQDENGDLGPVYGSAWRDFGGVDQISEVIEQIKTNPDSRRLIVSAWNPPELPKMALPPCHVLYQFYVQDGELSCQLYQRSNDTLLGTPFNIAGYSLLTHMIAHVCDLKVGEFIHTMGDAHIYNNHLTQVAEQLSREPLPLPTIHLNPEIRNIFDFKYDDIFLENYNSHPAIKAKVAV